ncbi:MAG: hypothetical protein KF805_04535 [Phycisphaeraceae bacterium]|nr:hypothetical protein [Phycisphaeraceae bacterium]
MKKNLLLVSACGLAATVQTVALAQPKTVTISGATLLENFVKSRGSTNDYIDVDKNGISGKAQTGIQQLAPTAAGSTVTPFPASQVWAVQYSGVGSIRGINELVNAGNPVMSVFSQAGASSLPSTGSPYTGLAAANASFQYYNSFRYWNGTAFTGGQYGNAGNPRGFPIVIDPANFDAVWAAPDTVSPGKGVRIDVAPSDVPGRWAQQVVGTPSPFATPGTAGYGANIRPSVNPQGTSAGAAFASNLTTLAGAVFYDPNNPPAVNATNVLFDQPLAFAPVSPVTNIGTGYQQVKMSALQHLFVTGRMPSGENLIAITRDIGSGTRNGFSNTIGIDPSQTVGDNVGGNGGTQSNAAPEQILGASYRSNNKGGNGQVESTVTNTRLGVGYVGPERGAASQQGWLANGIFELLAVQNDVYGGTVYSRANIDALLDNSADGFVIGGPAQFISRGSPLAESVADGGTGATLPKMTNPNAAAYLNNIRQSVAEFVAVPGGPDSDFMPGEVLAFNFILNEGLDNAHNPQVPTTLIPTPAFSQNLQDYLRNTNVLGASIFYSFNTTTNGRVPTRATGVVYSDGVANGNNYISQGGANVNYNANLTTRNKIAGDFSGNGVRDLADIGEMIKAFNQRSGGAAWSAPAGSGPIAGAPGTDAVIEILGDFNCDGSFTKADVRYFADGLLLSGGMLDRKAAFEEVDTKANTNCPTCAGINFFNTTLATASGGAVYTVGASRADVAGSGGIARGWAPVGADGIINASDIDYVYQQFNNPAFSGSADWSNLTKAANFDLSADMDANLVINQADVDYVVLGALQTNYGDVNLNRHTDVIDLNIWAANYNTGSLASPAGWAKGDVSGNGRVADEDYHIIMANRSCASDLNNDGFVDDSDFVIFAAAYDTLECPTLPALCLADLNDDGVVEDSDFVIFASAYNELLCP